MFSRRMCHQGSLIMIRPIWPALLLSLLVSEWVIRKLLVITEPCVYRDMICVKRENDTSMKPFGPCVLRIHTPRPMKMRSTASDPPAFMRFSSLRSLSDE